MVLILLGRSHADASDHSFFWEILYRSLATLVAQGEIEEGMLDSYEVHFYAPSKEELEDEVRKEGSFKLDRVEMLEIDKDMICGSGGVSYGTAVARTIRSIQEPMLAHHFGLGDVLLDKVFDVYGRLVDQELAKHDINPISTLLLLTKPH